MSEVKEIKQSWNKVQVVGTLKEMNLVQETKEVELSYGDKKKKVTCEVIGKKEFRNPMFLIDVNGHDIGIEMFGAKSVQLNDKGEIDKENGAVVIPKRFKALQTMLNTYNPKINCTGDDKPTRVMFDGSFMENSYAKDGEFKSFIQLNAYKGTHSGVPEEDYAKGEVTGIIKSMNPEIRIVNEEETGRLKVEFYLFDRDTNAFPINLIAEKEVVDPLEDLYEVGDSGKLFIDIVVKQVGGKPKTSSGGFGKREDITTGFNITEYSIVGADEKFEEEHDNFIDIGVMKEALNAREIMMSAKIEEAKNKVSTPEKKEPKSFGKKTEFKGTEGGNPFD